MTTVYVISKSGKRLMPTTRCGRVRHLLKRGQAVIVKHEPFTIRLTYDTTEYTQDIELCMDAGYNHIGVSVKSEKREFEAGQYDLRTDEKENHDDRRQYRRTRRNRLRYRAPRFNNRKRDDGWLAPSIQHKADAHLGIVNSFISVAPTTSITVEVGQFDTQLLNSISKGDPIPEGTDYQHGERYGIATLREAIFSRDKYKCRICGKGVEDGVILHTHHMLFWKNRHVDRVSEMITVCSKCHTPKNHQPGGALWGLKPDKDNDLVGAAFMNSVRWKIINDLRTIYPNISVHATYGAATKCARHELGIEKSHVNDAYAMGRFHPRLRAKTLYFEKRRRNNRVLEKFYDAKYVDRRDGKKKSGKELGCERTNRHEPRNSYKNLRIYREECVSKGRRAIRHTRYQIQPGTIIWIDSIGKRVAVGVHNNGVSVQYRNPDGSKKDVTKKKCKILVRPSGWKRITVS